MSAITVPGKPLVKINGELVDCIHFATHWCEQELLPTSWYKASKPTGERYTIVWLQDGTRNIYEGEPVLETSETGEKTWSLIGRLLV